MKRLLILILLFLISGCVTIYNPATGRKESYFINEESEISIGRNMADDIIRNKGIVNDHTLVAYVNQIGKSIAKISHRDSLNFEFYILDDTGMNAFALPGGYIFINKGLVEGTSEDELAFVIGHEIGHVCARHSLKRLQSSLGFDLLISIALGYSDYALVRDAVNITYNIIALGYSRKDEFFADSLGVGYVLKAGYKLRGAISLLRKLERLDKGEPLVFLRSHPKPEARIEKIKEKINTF
ncbi:MAG: M48 family metalloprotease [Omnitrophica bacterium]|nr:M48 family metalloprotease [Candidatus Omnitrophota bacterium]